MYTTAEDKKVNATFKISPSLKADLIDESTRIGMSLSEYGESILAAKTSTNRELQLENQLRGALAENSVKDSDLNLAHSKIRTYETLLGPLFNELRGQEIDLPNGQKIRIREPKDLLYAILECIKLKGK
jgi:hypothetical protein